MRKNTKRLILGLIAVAILGGIYAGLTHMPDEQDTSSNETKTLVSLDTDKLSSVHVTLSGGDDYTLTSTTENKKTTYSMSGSQDSSAYSDSLMQNLFSTASSVSGQVVETSCDDLSKYGLADSDSVSTVAITDTDGKTTTLRFGVSSDVVSGTYCNIDGKTAVYLVDSDTASALLEQESYYRNLTVLGSYYSLSSEVKSLTIDALADGTVLTIQARDTSGMDETTAKAYSDFVFTAPESCDADDSALKNGLLSDLQTLLTAQSIAEDNPSDLSQYGLDKPTARVHIKTNSIDATILIGSTTDDNSGCYVMKEGGSTVFISDASGCGFLDDTWSDWRSTNLLPFSLNEVSQITVTQDGTTHTVAVTQETSDEDSQEDSEDSSNTDSSDTSSDDVSQTATLDGETMSTEALQKLYAALDSVNYTRILDTPAQQQALASVTLTMTDGSTRSLSFAKGGSREYLVSVDGGAYAYGVQQDELTSITDALTTK